MQWKIIYRQDSQGIWHAIAGFAYHVDADNYLEKMQGNEPNRYLAVIENMGDARL